MYNIRKLFLLGISVIVLSNQPNTYCQGKSSTQIDIIFDASGSMWGQIDGKNKIVIARNVMKGLLTDFEEQKDTQLALRVYGHLNKQCDNSVLEIPMGLRNHSAIADKIQKIIPLGKTPIAYSLLESINDFNQEQNGDKIIILVTDGIESCDGNVCEAALELKNADIITKMHVVGFGMKEGEVESLKCIAEPFSGKVLGASNADELIEAFNEISEEVSFEKNVEIIGLDIHNNQVYMDVDIYQDNKKIYSSEGTSVMFYLKEGSYSVVAKSRETDIIIKNNIVIEEEEEKQIKLFFAESKVKLKSVNSNNDNIYAFYTFYNENDEEVYNTSGQDYTEKIILPGVYNIKIYEQDTYSTIWEKGVEIKPGETFEKVFLFAMGTINIRPNTMSGTLSQEYWWYEFYDSKTNKKIKTSTEGVGIKDIEILPGIYTMKVLDGYNKVVITVEDIIVEESESKIIDIIVE